MNIENRLDEIEKKIDLILSFFGTEEELRALSRKHNNNGFFKYCVRHGWIMPAEAARSTPAE